MAFCHPFFICHSTSPSIAKPSISTTSHIRVIRPHNVGRWQPIRRCPTFCMSMFLTPASLVWPHVGQAVLLNGVLFAIAKTGGQEVLTDNGLMHALALGILLWSCLWWPGYSLCFGFLVVGSLVTRVGRQEKERLGIAEKRGGARGPENVWGAAGMGAICAVCAMLVGLIGGPGYGNTMMEAVYRVLVVGYVAAMGTKLSDTLGSEIGKAFGTTTYLITTFEVVEKGREGGVSLEGTLAGVVGSVVVGVYAMMVGLLVGWWEVGVVVVGAFVGTTVESFIGAKVQEKWGWSNEFVNFVNTAVGAAVGMALSALFARG
eukprot:GFKZ01004319.1.p1 GENE.GFKZ01004319.1~~GFKZ01004319.1.p1  ORF type:complete len:317 (+),score=24.62 GFKZ01004319.1:673-1623(+)